LVIFPLSAMLAATAAIRSVLAQIKADGTPVNALPSLIPFGEFPFGEFLKFIGLPEVRALEQRFAAPPPATR
jgi:2-methylisocitrate lyase-like PEP mutase family enzyme